MKKYILLLLSLITLVSFTGCTYIGGFDSSNDFNHFDTELTESIEFSETLSQFDKLVLIVDLSVSGIEISASSDDTLTFEQKSNRKDLLAELDVDKNGDTVTLTFKNDPDKLFTTGSQNSQVKLLIPENIHTNLTLDINVGDIVLKSQSLEFERIVSNLDVGAHDLQLNSDQNTLDAISLSSNVGEISLALSGNFPSLKTIDTKCDVGSNSITMKGSYSEKMDINASTNVGELDLDLSGDFLQEVVAQFKANTGGIDLTLPKNSPTELEIDANEFTSDLVIKADQYDMKGNNYIFNASGKNGTLYIETETSIGDIIIR